MIVEDQTLAIDFMTRLAGRNARVELIETHISMIFLLDDRAYKMKRAVKLPYVDFSTPALRLEACKKEIVYNSNTAPDIYLGVRLITQQADGSVSFDGSGTLLDCVVEMVRFAQSDLMSKKAKSNTLSADLMTQVAQLIVEAHRAALIIRTVGGSENMSAVLDINEAGFKKSAFFDEHEVQALNKKFRTYLAKHRRQLDRREKNGLVRRCHGDLHLRNICVFKDKPTLFDCIEFNDQIANTDILYDLSFLLMDLWQCRLQGFANLVMNRHFDAMDDDEGIGLLGFFMAVRAAVRAHVTATLIVGSEAPSETIKAEARSYFSLAGQFLEASELKWITIGGLSGLVNPQSLRNSRPTLARFRGHALWKATGYAKPCLRFQPKAYCLKKPILKKFQNRSICNWRNGANRWFRRGNQSLSTPSIHALNNAIILQIAPIKLMFPFLASG